LFERRDVGKRLGRDNWPVVSVHRCVNDTSLRLVSPRVSCKELPIVVTHITNVQVSCNYNYNQDRIEQKLFVTFSVVEGMSGLTDELSHRIHIYKSYIGTCCLKVSVKLLGYVGQI
jgi:hypothetical protein